MSGPASLPTGPLERSEYRALSRELVQRRLREYLTFDSFLFRKLIALAGIATGWGLRAVGKQGKALNLWSALHRGAYARWADRLIENWVGKLSWSGREVFARHIEALSPQPATEVFFKDPERLIGTRILVLKSPGDNEKGVLALDYFFVFPLLAKLFNVREVARRYYLLLEPSWAGFCDPDLLCYLAQAFPVFIQTGEPRDFAFLQRLNANLVPVPVAGNWWVDHRVFRPLQGATRDADVLFLAAWGRYKRHDAFFSALARLRARGEKLKTILIGYKSDLTKDDIWRLARYHGVADQLEMHERLPPAEVNRHLNRVKVNVLWSRREGFNRAVIEGLFAGTPAIMRQGFNYGHPYPYINPKTGAFATERDLPDRLLAVIRSPEQFAPREWVMANMSPQRATQIIDETIGRRAHQAGEKWGGSLAVKLTALDAMSYWDESDRRRFEADYAFLRSVLRT